MSKIFNFIAIALYVAAAALWLFLGLFNPTGMDKLGQPLNPELYVVVGSVGYHLIGVAYLVPVGLVASIGFVFSWLANRFDR